MTTRNLKFCVWNIHGFKSRQLGNKLHSEDFLKVIKDQDFVGLTETHIHDEILEDLNIPGYKRLSYKNRKKNQKSHNASGGIAIFVKENLTRLFTQISVTDEDTIWVKIRKEAIKTAEDIYIGTHYMSPIGDTTDKIGKLTERVAPFQSKGKVLISGDFNARTGISNDTISSDKFDAELNKQAGRKLIRYVQIT